MMKEADAHKGMQKQMIGSGSRARAVGMLFGFIIGADATLGHAAPVDFSRDIEPILIKRCFECHGPDQQKGRLRLDSRAAATQAGKSGHVAIAPGRPDESELIQRVTHPDPEEVMPPKGGRLTEQEVTVLRQWIQENAQWPERDARQHWAFVRPVRPEAPTVSKAQQSWARNEI